jgi:AmmeMemoRadiSam system protein B
MGLVRLPAVADLFYPGDRKRLASMIAALLDAAEAENALGAASPIVDASAKAPAPADPANCADRTGVVDGGAGAVSDRTGAVSDRAGVVDGGAGVVGQTAGGKTNRVVAAVLPHAGYIYSGLTAAIGYRAVGNGYRAVVLAGPCHYVGTPFLALSSASYFRTPLGDVPVWQEGAELALSLPSVVVDDAVHQREHSLEVHLPFIQTVLGPDVPVLPLAVGWAPSGETARVFDFLVRQQDTLLLVSSDLSHYLRYEQAVTKDIATLEQMSLRRKPLVSDQACGVYALNGLSELAAQRGLWPEVLDYRNSADTAGDRQRVVGYAAVTFTEGPSDET